LATEDTEGTDEGVLRQSVLSVSSVADSFEARLSPGTRKFVLFVFFVVNTSGLAQQPAQGPAPSCAGANGSAAASFVPNSLEPAYLSAL
jgi:hypothetical protein